MRSQHEVPSGIFAHEGSGRARNYALPGMTGHEIALIGAVALGGSLLVAATQNYRAVTKNLQEFVSIIPKLKHRKTTNQR